MKTRVTYQYDGQPGQRNVCRAPSVAADFDVFGVLSVKCTMIKLTRALLGGGGV